MILIGAGALGSRHLQSLVELARYKNVENVEIADTNRAALDLARSRAEEILMTLPVTKRPRLFFFTDIADFTLRRPDLCIIASSSRPRCAILHSLLDFVVPKQLVLEKFLFPDFDDYAVAGRLLRNAGVDAWVNCPRASSPGYQWVKKKLAGAGKIEMAVSASNFHLMSNSIHHIELFRFFLNAGGTAVQFGSIDRIGELKPARREGYVDAEGYFSCTVGESRLSIKSDAAGSKPVTIDITTDNGIRIHINEAEGTIKFKGSPGDEKRSLELRQISDLAEIWADLIDGTTLLPTYENSSNLHKQFLHFVAPVFKGMPDALPRFPIT